MKSISIICILLMTQGAWSKIKSVADWRDVPETCTTVEMDITCILTNINITGSSDFVFKTERIPTSSPVNFKNLIVKESLLFAFPQKLFDEFSKLSTIEMKNIALHEITNDNFLNAIYLESLDLSYNNLTIIPDNTFNHLESLSKIDLSHNLISKLGANSFYNLTYLKELLLNNNRLEIIDGAMNDDLSALATINLSHNRLKFLKPEILGSFLNLNYIYVDSNQLQTVDDTMWINLSYLKAVSMRDNVIKSFSVESLQIDGPLHIDNNIIASLTLPPNVVCLHASNNNISELIFVDTVYVTQYLDLSENPLENFATYQLTKLENLNHIDLSNARLKSFDFDAASKLQQLKVLNLSNNHLHNLNLKPTTVLKNVEELRLENNKFTIINGSMLVKQIPSLKYVSLPINFWNCTAVATLCKQLNGTVEIQHFGSKVSCENNKISGCIKDDKPMFSIYWWFFLAFVVFILFCLIVRYVYLKRRSNKFRVSQNLRAEYS